MRWNISLPVLAGGYGCGIALARGAIVSIFDVHDDSLSYH